VTRVVTTPVFWEALERALPASREPNWHQFASYELGDILATFRQAWDSMPALYPELPDYRVHVGAGTLGAWSVVGHWSSEHREVQLVDITVDLWPAPEGYEPSADS
jgi:hypothetical protein